jgi:hypothetical protein
LAGRAVSKIAGCMNLSELHKKLIAAARRNRPSERVPLAFEKRILALLPERVALDIWGQWAGALWRATVPCVAVMLLLGAWSFFAANPAGAAGDLSQEIDNTILAAAVQEQPADSTW